VGSSGFGEGFAPTVHTIAGTALLTAHDIQIVRGDWERVEASADAAATLLYDRLFALDPQIRLLFPLDLAAHKLKVIQMLGVAVHGLSDPGVLFPILRLLGRKLVAFGVRPHHYETLASALTSTLHEELGDAFDDEHEAAWADVCAVLSAHIQTDAHLDA
jgi:hemoglobin-like flavoprotein